MKNNYFKAHEALLGTAHDELKSKSALVIGIGGLGCAALLYLSRCGLKCIGVADGDVVETSNLQRQVLFTKNDIGKNKAKVAAEKLRNECNIVAYPVNIIEDNAGMIKDYDIILDCTDSFAAKLLINDACACQKKPLVFGNALRWQGMCTLIDTTAGTACLACIFEGKDVQQHNACSNIGVLNSITGFIGALQATEAIKFLTGKGASGKLFVYDAEHNTVKTINYEKNMNCTTCNARKEKSKSMNNSEITIKELKNAIEDRRVVIIDVREPFERAQGAIAGDVSIPLGKLAEKCKEFGKNDFIVVYCAHGNRSSFAANLLKRKGFSNVKSLSGGYETWQQM